MNLRHRYFPPDKSFNYNFSEHYEIQLGVFLSRLTKIMSLHRCHILG